MTTIPAIDLDTLNEATRLALAAAREHDLTYISDSSLRILLAAAAPALRAEATVTGAGDQPAEPSEDELDVRRAVVDALELIDPETRGRVLRYAADRFGGGAAGTGD